MFMTSGPPALRGSIGGCSPLGGKRSGVPGPAAPPAPASSIVALPAPDPWTLARTGAAVHDLGPGCPGLPCLPPPDRPPPLSFLRQHAGLLLSLLAAQPRLSPQIVLSVAAPLEQHQPAQPAICSSARPQPAIELPEQHLI